MPPLQHYSTFDLEITPSAESYRARVLASPAGETEGSFAFPFTQEEWDRLAALPSEEIGARIFDALFVGPVAEAWRSSLARLNNDEGMRLNLRLPDAPELAALPWELLYDSTHQHFLALDERTPVNRYLPLPLAQEELAVEPPLRVLVILSAPVDHEPLLEVEEEWQRIQTALAPMIATEQIELERLAKATWDELQGHLRKETIHILHFVGHGLFESQQGNGGLLFEDEEGFTQLISARKLAHLLRNHPSLRLALLNACEGAVSAADNPFSGVAQALVQKGIPAVIAMQEAISDRAALTFGPTFYAAVADGYPVDAALTQARMAVYAENDWEWAMPVLFMRSQDGQLFQVDLKKADQEESTAQSHRAQILIVPPPPPTPVPVMSTFSGREAELAAYAQRLQAEGLVVVAGMPGVGKSAFAAKLAERVGGADGIFWHTFYHGEGIQSLIWKLAGFLAWHDLPDLWQMVQGAQQSGGQLPPPNVLVDYIFQLLRGKHFLLCLDDFHLLYDNAEDDALLQQFVDRMRLFVESEPLRLIVISRSTPAFLSLVDAPLFGGMTVEDTRTLLIQRGVNLNQDLFDRLYARTEGNAELLLLASRALEKARRPEQVIERLVETDDIERYLMAEVDKGLSEDDRAVMGGVAALLGYPGTRDAIEEALAGQNVRRTLTYLTNRYLLLVRSGEWDREYVQHTIVQAFYYELLGRRERQAIHLRVAKYYEHEEQDGLRAAIHYERAGEIERAAALATQDLGGVVNRGEAQRLRSLLESFRKQDLSPMRWAQVQGSLGQLFKHASRSQEAEGCYAEALRTLENLDDTPATRQERATLHRLRAEMTQQSDPQAALTDVDRGLALVGEGDDPETRVTLLLVRSSVLIVLGEFADALKAAQAGLALLPVQPSSLGIDGLFSLGTLYSYQGKLDQAIETTQQALDMAEELHDVYRMIGLLSNLAIDKFQLGRWAEAVADNRRALELMEQTGSERRRGELELNLGAMLVKQDRLAEAETLLTSALARARAGGQQELEVIALCNLADTRLRQGQPEQAHALLGQAGQLAHDLEIRYLLPEIYRLQAEVALAQDDLTEAEKLARQSIALAKEMEMPDEQAAAEKVLAQMRD